MAEPGDFKSWGTWVKLETLEAERLGGERERERARVRESVSTRALRQEKGIQC
jgi:hypothetical protein